MNVQVVNTAILNYYSAHKRLLPWRENITPYGVIVSEIMLQQTQVPRVLTKYPEFLARFPDFSALTSASTEDVIRAWQGMGYNRRARYLKLIAEKIVHEFGGNVPESPEILETFPGIGHATARSIVTFIYNTPQIFIETNVRRVFIHHCYEDREDIHDREIYPLVEQALDKKNPREWYYAIMDYGTHLKKIAGNANRKSAHYTKQSAFEGSTRQVRSDIVKLLLGSGPRTQEELVSALLHAKHNVKTILEGLIRDGMIQYRDGRYSL